MKTTLILLLMFPLMTLADIAPTPTYYRYQRIGFEVLPDASAQLGTPAGEIPVLAVLSLSFAVGLFLCLCARKDLRAKTLHMAGSLGKWFVVCILRTLHGCCVCAFVLLLVPLWDHLGRSFRGEFRELSIVELVLSVLVFGPVIGRGMLKRRFPSLFGMGIFIASSLAAVVLMVLLIIIARTEASQVCSYDLDSAPGWKYPFELSEKERAALGNRLDSLPSRMSRMVEDAWKKNSLDGRSEHAIEVITSILEDDAELRVACMGVPVEMIVERYFTVNGQSPRDPRCNDFFIYPRAMSFESVLATAAGNETVLCAIELFNKKFMSELPKLEAWFESHSGIPHMRVRGWQQECEAMMRKAIGEDVDMRRRCLECPVQAFVKLIDFPDVSEWFGYAFHDQPDFEGKRQRDVDKPHLARLRLPPRRFGYVGADGDDSVVITRRFAWFTSGGVTNEFALTVPRNADRLMETDAGGGGFDCFDLFGVGLHYKDRWPGMPLGDELCPIGCFPDFTFLGEINDGFDRLECFRVTSRRPFRGYRDVQVMARRFVNPKTGKPILRVTDMMATRRFSSVAALNDEISAVRSELTSKGTKTIWHLMKERKENWTGRKDTLIFESSNRAVFMHWERRAADKFDLYLILTEKWGYKGGVDIRDHKTYGQWKKTDLSRLDFPPPDLSVRAVGL